MTDTKDPDLLDLAYPYAMHAIAETERHGIEHRLSQADPATVAAFEATVRDVHETLASLTVVDAMAPPSDLEAKVLHALDELTDDLGHPRDIVGPQQHSGIRRLRGRMSRLDFMAAAVVLILALIAGVAWINRDIRHSPTGITAQQVEQQPDLLTRTVPIANGGTLVVRTSARMSALSASFENVPQPPPGRAYQLWLVPSGAKPISAEVLDAPAANGTVLVTHYDPIDTLAITVEPAGGSPQPTNDPIARLNLE